MKTNTSILLAALIGATSLTTGCATVTRGTTQEISVDSTPQGAMVETSGATYTTPAAIKLKRNIGHKLNFTKVGYEPASAVVTPAINGGGAAGMAGNILLGGIIGAAVDAGSGAMYDLEPGRVPVALEKSQ